MFYFVRSLFLLWCLICFSLNKHFHVCIWESLYYDLNEFHERNVPIAYKFLKSAVYITYLGHRTRSYNPVVKWNQLGSIASKVRRYDIMISVFKTVDFLLSDCNHLIWQLFNTCFYIWSCCYFYIVGINLAIKQGLIHIFLH